MFQGDNNDLCWSHSYYDDNDDSLDWQPCKPKGFSAQNLCLINGRHTTVQQISYASLSIFIYRAHVNKLSMHTIL